MLKQKKNSKIPIIPYNKENNFNWTFLKIKKTFFFFNILFSEKTMTTTQYEEKGIK